MTKTDGLDDVIRTFTKDREFCEAIATSHPMDVGRLLVYANWAHAYMSPIQEDLHAIALRHFPQRHAQEAALWTLTMTGGVMKDLLLVPYFVIHGAISEGGFVLRRSLENVGVLAHLWHEPTNSAYLHSPDGQDFRKAFIWESNDKRKALLRARRVQKRFERCEMPEPLSSLYTIFSSFTVHGGSPNQLAGADLSPTAFSCALLHRPDPRLKDIDKELNLLGNGCEMLCIEIVSIHGTYGKQYGVIPSKGGEGGFYLTKLLGARRARKCSWRLARSSTSSVGKLTSRRFIKQCIVTSRLTRHAADGAGAIESAAADA